MIALFVSHVLCMFVTFNRETSGGQINFVGTVLKIIELLSMGLLYTCILHAMSQVTIWHTLKGNIDRIIEVNFSEETLFKENIPECLSNPDLYNKMTGRTL